LTIIRPRLNDHYDLPLSQADVDFAIPFLDEDIPFYVDPFLLWKSPSMQDNSLHFAIVNSFNYLGHLMRQGKNDEAISTLIRLSECREVGLGVSKSKRGAPIGEKTARRILALFTQIPQVRQHGFTHVEEIQLLVDQIAKDRISDIACSYLKSFLIDFTIEQADKYGIPCQDHAAFPVYDHKNQRWIDETVRLPANPETQEPILFVPKRWLRSFPWIHYEDYYTRFYMEEIGIDEANPPERIAVLNYNRHNYDMVRTYIAAKERTQADCRNDPLFEPIPILSARRKFRTIRKLPTGKTDSADRQYETAVTQMMASLLYPELDFAAEQSRTDSGVLIRDLIFYNSRSMDFLQDVFDQYDSRQIVMELKNVKEIEREHINQLHRYLGPHLGRFGILVTRNPLSRKMFKNTVDLWSGQRTCILALTDQDLELMVTVYESKQRLPIEVIKKKYVEFIRACPA